MAGPDRNSKRQGRARFAAAVLAAAIVLAVFAPAADAKRIVGGPAPETLIGTKARDALLGKGSADTLLGKGGGDRLVGGAGGDMLIGGGGRDTIRGGPGDDQVKARDRVADRVSCGPGWDVAIVDPIDSVAADCEVVEDGSPAAPRPAIPGPAGPVGPQGPAGPPGEPSPEPDPPAEPIPAYEENPVAMFPAGHGWTGNGVGEFADAGPPFALNDDRSFRITTDGAGAASIASSPLLEPVDLRGSHVAFQSLTSFSSRLESVKLRLASGDLSTDYAEASVWQPSDSVALTGRFETQSIPRRAFEVVGEVDWSAIDRAQIIVTDNAVGPMSLYVAGIYAVPTYKQATVSFAFDDGVESTFTRGLKRLSALRYPATLYVIADTIGTPGFLDEEQLYALRDEHGWEIGGHAGTIADHNEPFGLDSLDPAELKADFDELRSWMDDHGFARRTFAYPKGAASAEVRKYAARDYCAARMTAAGPETVPPRNPFTVRGWSINGVNTNLDEMKAMVDRAVAEKSWAVLTFHDLVTGPLTEPNDVSIGDFNQIVTYVRSLQAQKQLQVRTIADAVGC